MAYQSLASRYRPQTFGEVVGQTIASTALSRASSLGSPAPAYLLSGTRGVGKTTIARIFAKALNCANGPGPEPCNKCQQCLHITEGNHVDVSEIDAASNTGVDDVRALRENIGFMPMEGRFKIFIVDEAHMLSKSAFNALLKTLEEPPPHTVFIFATTEAHRFPPTIISRCQHYVFNHLPESMLCQHLRDILQRENMDFDEEAIGLIGRRAAGSVRDSLSLLDQTLCFTQGRLTAQTVRQSLGLAGADFYRRCIPALAKGDLPELIALSSELLDTGVDIGFFLKEFINQLRNLFLLAQTGDAILPELKLPADEIKFLRESAKLFSATHLHAAWQMALQNQRSILQGSQPGPGLELLLLNLAMLPKLLPIEKARPDLSRTGEIKTQNHHPQIIAEEAATYGQQKSSLRPVQKNYTWENFCDFCRKAPAEETPGQDVLKAVSAIWKPGKLQISASSPNLWTRLQKARSLLQTALQSFCDGAPPEVEYIPPGPVKSRQEMLDDCAQDPQVQLCQEIMGGRIADCYQRGENYAQHE